MSIKTTQALTRGAAERFYVELRLEEIKEYYARVAANMSDEHLGDRLDQLTDDQADRNGVTNFNNYLIVRDTK